MDAIEALKTRHSVRAYKPDPVADSDRFELRSTPNPDTNPA